MPHQKDLQRGAATLPLHILIRSRVLALKGSWRLDDDPVGTVAEINGLPVTYECLINVAGQNVLIFPDDIALIRSIGTSQETKRYEEFSFRVITHAGTVNQMYLTGTFAPATSDVDPALIALLKAHAEVEKTSQILRQAEELAPLGSWAFDREEGKLTWSDGLYSIFDLPAGSPVQPDIYRRRDAGGDGSSSEKIISSIRDDPQPFNETIRINAGKMAKTIRVKATVINDETGKPSAVVGADLDVTSILESQRALKEQTQLMSNLLKTIPDLVSVVNLETLEFEYLNQDLSFTTAETIEKLDVENNLRRIHPQDYPLIKEYLHRFLSLDDEGVNTVEFRWKKAGEWEWFRTRGKVFKRNTSGIPTHCVNVAQNVSAVKRSQQEVIDMKEALANQARKQYEDLFESIDQGFAIVDLIYDPGGEPMDCIIMQTNPAATKITGFQDIEGHTIKEIMPHVSQEWLNALADVHKTQKPLRLTVKGPAERAGWYEACAFGFRGAAERTVAVLFNDITERIYAAEALRDKQRKLDVAQRAGGTGIWTFYPRLQGGLATKELRELIGYAGEGETWSLSDFLSVVDPRDRDLIQQAFEKSKEAGSIDVECRLRHPQRGRRWFLVRGTFFNAHNDEDDSLMGSLIDITERKALEEQKDQFIGIASHELKTPVTSIKAYADILAGFLSTKGEKAHSAMMQRMVTQVDRLIKLINDLLDTTKISGGVLVLEPEPFDLNRLIHERMEEIQRSTTHVLTFHRADVPQVYADRGRIGQVLNNLLSNAIKYSPEGSGVIITTRGTNGNVLVSVRDFGIGLSDEAQQKIFERFYRVSSINLASVPGLGLGLYIASEIIRKHGGTLGVSSVPGEGSEFFFTLPVFNELEATGD